MKFLKKHRYRTLFLLIGVLIVTLASWISDPDLHHLSTLLGGLAIGQGIWAIAAAHWARRALTYYVDQQMLFKKACEHPIGAGLALIALSILFVGLLLVFSPRAHANGLPEGFKKYGGILKTEQQKYWSNHPDPALLAALVEQESCVTLRSKSCWNPAARLKTSREEGAGMGQLTRAYRADGVIRFDALSELSDQYRLELQGLSWDTIYKRPDLQMRSIVLKSRDAANRFHYANEWLAFGDAAYNGGIFGVQKERRACQLTNGCDPNRWFGQVERHCLKSRQAIYGTRSACDINREHVYNVFYIRKSKYITSMNEA